jgi:ubiquinone/menaquinone biosynthesis C-methylase UbiE/uncharacterized protein YbaR (Trm112 family)
LRERLLTILRCPNCGGELSLIPAAVEDGEVISGFLHCEEKHFYPIFGGIPRMLPNSLSEYGPLIAPDVASTNIDLQRSLNGRTVDASHNIDLATKANFSNEWDNHDIGGRTWTMELNDRVEWFFLDPIQIDKRDLSGKVMLDAGCGNGSQSVAYTQFGLEVVAVDISTGLEKGYEFRKAFENGRPENVHFVQADLQSPPFAKDSFDIIHSAGVLHHTSNTEKTFRTLRPMLKVGGTFYVWLYKYENVVTPLVNSMRAVTTRLPSTMFANIAGLMATPFIGFCWLVDKFGIRKYTIPKKREATLAIHDIFGAPYAHYHSFEEVQSWFTSEGISDVWSCNDSRRGFGVCGRIPQKSNEMLRNKMSA